mmetsp:Transcript_15770/g.15223  ORF Transcript_15770/g.15223 Transcript_15770/m.15223 type:complete len:105 (+) Transcript_15770:158-472(+)
MNFTDMTSPVKERITFGFQNKQIKGMTKLGKVHFSRNDIKGSGLTENQDKQSRNFSLNYPNLNKKEYFSNANEIVQMQNKQNNYPHIKNVSISKHSSTQDRSVS